MRWVYFIGNDWLVPTPDLRGVIYHGPAEYPLPVRIGVLDLCRGPTQVGKDRLDVDFIAWKVARCP